MNIYKDKYHKLMFDIKAFRFVENISKFVNKYDINPLKCI